MSTRPIGYISSDSGKLPVGRRGTRVVRASVTLHTLEGGRLSVADRTLDVELNDRGEYRVVERATGKRRVISEIATGTLASLQPSTIA